MASAARQPQGRCWIDDRELLAQGWRLAHPMSQWVTGADLLRYHAGEMDRYCHSVIGPVAQALTAVPELSNRRPDRRPPGTGTDDAVARRSDRVRTNVVHTGAPELHSRSPGDTKLTGETAPEAVRQRTEVSATGEVRHSVTSPGTEATVRTRTGNLRFTKPLLCQLSYGGKAL